MDDKAKNCRWKKFDMPSVKLFAAILILTVLASMSVYVDALPNARHEIVERLKRYIINDHEVTVNVEWLTDEQLSELGTLDSPSQVNKIRHFYEQLVSSEERKAAANKIISQCYDWLPEVTTEAERSELKRLHKANHTECWSRIAEYIGRLAEHRQTHLRKYWEFCEHVSNDTTQYGEHVEGGEVPDEDEEEVRKELERSTVVEENVEMTTIVIREEESKTRHQTRQQIINPIRVRRSSTHEYEHHSPIHDLESCFKTHLIWLSENQKYNLRAMKKAGKSDNEIQSKVFDFYDQTVGETRDKATELLKSGCVNVFKTIFGEEKYAEVKRMHETGQSMTVILEKMSKYLDEIQDPSKKQKAKDFGPHCQKLFVLTSGPNERQRRDISNVSPTDVHNHKMHHNLEDYFKTHLAWLNDRQKEELKTLKAEGKNLKEMQAKIQEYYQASSGETKNKATELLKEGCVELFKSLFGHEKFEKIKRMKEDGISFIEINAKIATFVEDLDENKKALAQEYGPNCRKLFQLQSPTVLRKRRELLKNFFVPWRTKRHLIQPRDPYTIEDYYRDNLVWFSKEQRDELKDLVIKGSNTQQVIEKILNYYSNISNKTIKGKAAAALKHGCRIILKWFLGFEKFKEIEEMKRNGIELEKINFMIKFSENMDQERKKRVNQYGSYCETFFFDLENKPRVRRHSPTDHTAHHGSHTLDDYFRTHLSWLSDAQKDKLRAMKAEGKFRTDLQEKVMEFYGATTGELREKASELMKGGCVELFKAIFGQEKYERIIKLKENNASMLEIEKNIGEFIATIDNDHQKTQIKEYGPQCKFFFNMNANVNSSSRLQRHIEEQDHIHSHEHQSLDEYINTHLSWLTDSQKEELRVFKANGMDRSDLYAKIGEYYEKTEGEIKIKATTQLKTACREMFVNVFGEEKLEELKKMKLEGKDSTQIVGAVQMFVNNLDDEAKKDKVKLYVPYCKKLYSSTPTVRTITRKRRDAIAQVPVEQDLGEYFQSHLAWLNEEQKAELSHLKAEGKGIKEMKARIQTYYAEATGERKAKATNLLKSGCTELFKSIFGVEKFEEIKSMKESGKSMDKISMKITEYQAQLSDPVKKAQAEEYGPNCKRLFSVSGSSRKRRNIHRKKHRSLLDYFETHLSWLSDKQKEILWRYELDGKSDSRIQATIEHFYSQTRGARRRHAKHLLRGACAELFTALFGADAVTALERVHASNATLAALNTHVDTLISKLSNEDERAKARDYVPYCQRLNDGEEKSNEYGLSTEYVNDIDAPNQRYSPFPIFFG